MLYGNERHLKGADLATARVLILQMMGNPFRPISREYAEHLLAEVEKEREG